MIDGLKILDTFEYKGVQGFVHSDMSLSSVIKLEEIGDIRYMKEIDINRYISNRESIINSLSPFGNGNVFPPVKSIGGVLYQYFSIPNERFDEELEVIKNSNNNITFYKGLLDQIVVEEMEKVARNFNNLKKYENFIFIRTYLSAAEEKAFKFKINNKTYTKNNFDSLYTELLENNYETETVKEGLFAKLNTLFEKHKSAATKFGSQTFSEEEVKNDGLIKDNPKNKLLDVLGQINAIRGFFSLPKKKIYSKNNQPTFQIFDTKLEFEKDAVKIDTNRLIYNIYNKYNEIIYSLYEDENGAVVIEDKKLFETYLEFNSYIIDNRDADDMRNIEKGIFIVKEDLKENISAQFPVAFLSADNKITVEKLYKYYRIFNIEGIPEEINPRLGELLIKEINQTFSDKIIKANFSINFFRSSNKQLEASLSTERFAWTTVASLPSLWGWGYDPEIVKEKIEVIEQMKEIVRKGRAKFLTTQMFITIVSYTKVDIGGELENLLLGSNFEMEVVQEKHLASEIMFSSVSPLAYNIKTIKQDKEVLLTQEDIEGLINMSIGTSQFSLTRPVIIGISNGTRVCYIDTYDPRIEAPNGIVVGATGSGKSFTKIYELIKLLFLPLHPLIIIIDRGGSFMNFVKIFGGKAVSLDLSSAKNNINPFIYNEEFKKYLILLANHLNNNYTEQDVINKYSTPDGETIYEMKNTMLYTKDANGYYHVLLPNDLSPQVKLNFFSRIIFSMSKTNRKDFKKIINDILIDIVTENKKTFKKKANIYKNSILIREKGTNKILLNTKNILKRMDGTNIYITDQYEIKQIKDSVEIKYLEIIGKKEIIENAYIEKVNEEIEHTEEVLYFTIYDVQERLKKIDEKKYKEEINILDAYVSLTEYGNLFNGPPALNFDDELLWTIDMGEETPEDLAAIILQSLNIIQWNSIMSPHNKARKKMIIFDEVHQILANVEDTGPAEAIGYMYRTIRKHGGGIHILSQSSADIFKKSGEVPTELLNTFNGIKSNAMYKYIIGINSTDAERSKEDFQLTETETSEIVEFSEKKSTDASQRGMIYINTKAFKGFLNIVATPTIYAIATTMKEEKNLQEAIEKLLKKDEKVKALFLNYNINDEDKKNNIITSIKIVIFKTLFPKGISSYYGQGTKDIFLKKHIDMQPDGVDKYQAGFSDFLYNTKNQDRYNDLIKNELRKLEELLSY